MNAPHEKLRSELEKSLCFESLVIDLSTRFINVPADRVDNEIEDAQRRVCECLQLDASLLWQLTDQPSARLRLTHMYRPQGGLPAPDQLGVETSFPWCYAQVLAGGMYVNSTLDDLPPQAAHDKASFGRYGIKSNIGLPLSVGGGTPVGVLTFNTTRQPLVWTEAVVKRLQLVGQIFANALARKHAEAEARLRLRQLAHLHRVATMGELATALAHELNQPLGAILRNAEAAELLLKSVAPDLQELRAIVTDIKRDDERAGSVINRLRSLLRQRSIELRPTDMPALVDEVVALTFADAAGRGIRIVSEVPQGIAAVRCDRVHVQQVLLNLIVNAMDAIGQPPAGDPCVVVGARETGSGQVEVWVRDGGPGITSELLSSIFEPFFTTKPWGLGMGLAISRTLVEAQGGRLWAESAERGTCFRFTLQIASAAEASA